MANELKRSNLKRAAYREARKLKKYATVDELKSLNFKYLDGNNIHTCIYGLMTGSCYSQRAFELLQLCGLKYADSVTPLTNKFLNVFSRKTKFLKKEGRIGFSALELFLNEGNSSALEREELINYLKRK